VLQFYVDTVKQMALRQLVAGSPLRTLCLLIAGQPAEVFSTDSSLNGHPGASNMAQVSAQVILIEQTKKSCKVYAIHMCCFIASIVSEVISFYFIWNSTFCCFGIQVGSNGMLDDWEENLAVITANRTKGDELVIIHLGDCLWKERSEVQFSIFHFFFKAFTVFLSGSHLRFLF